MIQDEILEVKVTRGGQAGWFVQIKDIRDSSVVCESLCERQCDIGYATRDMLRTLDKLGYPSPMAHASRFRSKNFAVVGKIKFVWGSFRDRIEAKKQD